MPTDDERREVARKLREFSRNTWQLTIGGNSATIRYAISDIVFDNKKYHSGVDLLNRLADLIEPTCDRDALLGLADELKAQQANKGIRQIGPYMQPGDAARRIREAIGVTDEDN